MTIEGFDDENSALIGVKNIIRAIFSSSNPSIVTQTPSNVAKLSVEQVKMARSGLNWAIFFRITRPKGGILKTARPAQTRPNGDIPLQNGRMAGL